MGVHNQASHSTNFIPNNSIQKTQNIQGINSTGISFYDSPIVWLNLARHVKQGWVGIHSQASGNAIGISNITLVSGNTYNVVVPSNSINSGIYNSASATPNYIIGLNSSITIYDAVPSTFNGTYTVQTTPTVSGSTITFEITYPINPGTYTSSGLFFTNLLCNQNGLAVSSVSDTNGAFYTYLSDFGTDIMAGTWTITWTGTGGIGITYPSMNNGVFAGGGTPILYAANTGASGTGWTFTSSGGVNTITITNYNPTPTMEHQNGVRAQPKSATITSFLTTIYFAGGSLETLEIIPAGYQANWSAWKSYVATTGLQYQTALNSTVHPFNPDYITYLKGLNVSYIRHMSDNGIGEGYIQLWANRPTLVNGAIANFSALGTMIPLEDIISIANVTNTSVWVTLPMQGESIYYSNALELLDAGLDKSLIVYVEISNEIWNPGGSYIQSQIYASNYTGTKQIATIDSRIWYGSISFTSGSTTATSNTIASPSLGMTFAASLSGFHMTYATGISNGTYVTAISGSAGNWTLTLSVAATATTTNSTVYGFNTYFTCPNHGYTGGPTGGTPLGFNTLDTYFINNQGIGYPFGCSAPYYQPANSVMYGVNFISNVIDANTFQISSAVGTSTLVNSLYSCYGTKSYISTNNPAINPAAIEYVLYAATKNNAWNPITVIGSNNGMSTTGLTVLMNPSWQVGTAQILSNAFSSMDGSTVPRSRYRKCVGYQYYGFPTSAQEIMAAMTPAVVQDIDFVHGAPYFYVHYFGFDIIPSINGTLALKGYTDSNSTLNYAILPAGTVITEGQIVNNTIPSVLTPNVYGSISATTGNTSNFLTKTNSTVAITGGNISSAYVSGLTPGNSYDCYFWNSSIGNSVKLKGLQKITITLPTSANIITVSTITASIPANSTSMTVTAGTPIVPGLQVGGLAISPISILNNNTSPYVLDGTISTAISGASLPLYCLSSFSGTMSGNTITISGTVTGQPLQVGMSITGGLITNAIDITSTPVNNYGILNGLIQSTDGTYGCFITAISGSTITLNISITSAITSPLETFYVYGWKTISTLNDTLNFTSTVFNDIYNTNQSNNAIINSFGANKIRHIGYEANFNSISYPFYSPVQYAYMNIIENSTAFSEVHTNYMNMLGQNGGFYGTTYFATLGSNSIWVSGSDLSTYQTDNRYLTIQTQNNSSNSYYNIPTSIFNMPIYIFNGSTTYPQSITLPSSDLAGSTYTHSIIDGDFTGQWTVSGNSATLSAAPVGYGTQPNTFNLILKSKSANITSLNALDVYVSSAWYQPDAVYVWDSKLNNGLLPSAGIQPIVGTPSPTTAGTIPASVPANGWWNNYSASNSNSAYVGSNIVNNGLTNFCLMVSIKGLPVVGDYSYPFLTSYASIGLEFNGTVGQVNMFFNDGNYNISSVTTALQTNGHYYVTYNFVPTVDFTQNALSQVAVISGCTPSTFDLTTNVGNTIISTALNQIVVDVGTTNPGTWTSGGYLIYKNIATLSTTTQATVTNAAISGNGTVLYIFYDSVAGQITYGGIVAGTNYTINTINHKLLADYKYINFLDFASDSTGINIGCTQIILRGASNYGNTFTLSNAVSAAIEMANYMAI